MVSAQLEDSLRRDIESYIEGRLGGIKQEIAALQSQLNESLSQLLDRQGEVQLDGAVGASIVEHLRAAHEEGIDLAASESSRAKASSDVAIIKAAISEIDEQQSQAEILKVLVNRAASFAPRVAFFVIKGDQGIGWRARGLQGTVGDQAVQQIKFALSADTTVGGASRSGETWSGGPGSHADDHLIVNHLGEEPPTRLVAVPLVVRGRSVAVLYADSGDLDSEAINLEALETLVRVAGMAVELLVARSGAAAQPAPARAEEPTTEARGYTPTVEYDELTPVVEESAPTFTETAPIAVEPEPVAAEPEPAAPVEVESTPALAPLSDPFAQTSPPVVAETAPPAEAPRRRYGADVELPIEVSNDEERRFHTDARRFARLLVSEIKLYKESQVNEGRSRNDLYDRLRDDIERSREMYDKRVKPEVAQRYDYFHHELVNTLAEGDAAKLGNSYPGTTVSA
ncbi:MAG TPA: hypothetical protein DC047_00995 [Blastocatellia bacterium]|nr:hypothetical protein [Blastocatellia bacterium]